MFGTCGGPTWSRDDFAICFQRAFVFETRLLILRTITDLKDSATYKSSYPWLHAPYRWSTFRYSAYNESFEQMEARIRRHGEVRKILSLAVGGIGTIHMSPITSKTPAKTTRVLD